MAHCGFGRRFSVGAFFFLAVFCFFPLFQETLCFAGEKDKGKAPPPDQIDRIVALLPSPADFESVRDLFLHYALTVKSATVSPGPAQDSVIVRIDFFLPVPPHCRPSAKERVQYYLEEGVWTKSDNSDSFVPVNSWARHIADNESDWFQNISCYP